jgi:hypothetical protein
MIKWIIKACILIIFLVVLFNIWQSGLSWITESEIYKNTINLGNKTYQVIDKGLDDRLESE